MIVTLHQGSDARAVQRELVALGLWTERLTGDTQAFRVMEGSQRVATDAVRAIDGVREVFATASQTPKLDAQRGTQVDAAFAGAPLLMAGPCAVESPEQIDAVAALVKRGGGHFLRGGAFKPRTSPYSFRGHGQEALQWLADAGRHHGLKVVTEAMSPDQVTDVANVADMIQIGARNMQSFSLLEAVGRAGKPVMLKRGLAATINEWLNAAEYCLLHGATQVVLCERGIRSFDPETRNVLDLGGVALLRHVYGLPVIADPSHAAGRRDLILPLAKAALAAGAAGILVETHTDAGTAMSL